MARFTTRFVGALLATSALFISACSSDPADGGATGGTGSGATGGSSGTGGGTAGGGTAGATGGSSGTGGGTAGGGAGGTGGAAGTAGTGGGGTGGTAGTAGGGTAGTGGVAAFELTSPALEHNEDCGTGNLGACNEFPQSTLLETIGGDNISPELNWGAGPEGTMSYAIVLHDYSNNYTHWAMWNIPAATSQLPSDLPRETNPATPAGAQQVSFDDVDNGYQGPGADDHVYEFRLYALSVATFTPGNAGDQGSVRGELENDGEGIVLETTDLRGKSPP
jgi:Raf kinase inhibitor-like YbhB/YbcL family protein